MRSDTDAAGAASAPSPISIANIGLRSFALAAAIVLAAGCGAPSVTRADTAITVPPATRTPPAVASTAACATVGGTVDSRQRCRYHDVTPSYTLDFTIPTDYPDQQGLANAVTQERDTFIDWVTNDAMNTAETSLRSIDLVISGETYRSGTPNSGTRSVVLTIGSDAGMHPVMTYRALNFDLKTRTPITFDTLFKPGTRPLDVLNPIVEHHIEEHGGPSTVTFDDVGAQAYQSFALTDDAIVFYFDQDGLLTHADGPLMVSVPRADIASLLA